MAAQQQQYTNLYDADGKRHGLWVIRYPDGQPKEETTYEHGNLHGSSKHWYRSGQPTSECTFEHGRRHGLYKSWYADGHPLVEGTYKHGLLHGLYKSWGHGGLYEESMWEHNEKVEKPAVVTECRRFPGIGTWTTYG